MAYQGIDYGLGRTNINHASGIRYGVISQHSLASWFYDSFEAFYGPATCPKCGKDAEDSANCDDIDEDVYEVNGKDYICRDCRYSFWSDEAFGEEPLGYTLDEDGYIAEDCLDSDVILTASPFYTFGPFCSPCVPGAVNLDDAMSHEDTRLDWHGASRAFCFGHEWFEDGRAPYRVFSVETDEEVFPNA